MNKNIACVILAAGKGERMKSATPKVLHNICGRPMLGYVLDLVKELKIKTCVTVLGYKNEEVKKYLGSSTKTVLQKKLVGTGDAVKEAEKALRGFKGTVLVLYGDTPLLTKETIEKLLKRHEESFADATLLTVQMAKPDGYGRILRDKYSMVCGIIEDKDANEVQKDIKEINSGIICFNNQKLVSVLKELRPNNRKKEYYLTDVISIFYKKDYLVENLKITDINEAMGINSRVELAKANSIMQARLNEKYMKDGVTLVDPSTTFISYGTKIGLDTIIYPFTVVETNVKIGARCHVGPFAHLREDTILEDEVTAGNFLEVVRSKIGKKTFVKHFTYIGDSVVGRDVNIGAGTVTANFDHGRKSHTVIKDGACIGSDTILVAPVVVGKKAITGAGAVLAKNKNIPDNAVAVGVPARILAK